MTTGAQAKRVALLASTEDGAFVRSLTRALDERGLSARRVSESGLKVALRAPDLTVILGDPPDGGVSTVESVGADRGPYAVLMTPGALAARLEARRHGLHIIPRQDDDDVAEIADAVERLIADLASGAAVEPAREHAAVPLDALDWDEDEPETVAKRESGAPSVRPSGLGRAKSGAPRLPSFRTTLTEGMSAPPPPHGEPSPTYDDVTVQSSEPLKLASLHEAVTRPHMIDPAAVDPHELTTRQLVSPPPQDEVETVDAPFGYDTVDDRRGTSGLAEALRARRADADTTAPHLPITAEPTSDPDITAPQRPVLMLRKPSDGGSEEVAPPPPPPNRTALARAKAATASGEVDAVTGPRPAATSASEISSGPTDPEGVPRLDRGAPPPASLRRTAAFGSILGSMTASKTGADASDRSVSRPASGERPAVPGGAAVAHAGTSENAASANGSGPGARRAGAETAAGMPSATPAEAMRSSTESEGASAGTPPASAGAATSTTPAGTRSAMSAPSPAGTAPAPASMTSSPAGAVPAGAPTPAMAPPAPSPPSAPPPMAEAQPAKSTRRRGWVLAVVAVVAVVGLVALAGAGAMYLTLGPGKAPEWASSDPPLRPAEPATPLAPPPAPPPGAPSEDVAPSRPEDSAEPATAARDDEPVAEEVAAPPEPELETVSPTPDVRASELSPEEARDRSDVFVAEGQQHERAGRLAEAQRAFEQAAEIHDLNPHAHSGLARVALEAGDPRSAVDHADRAATLRRRRPEYQILLGDARRAAGDTAGARRAYEQALDLDPGNAEARARLGRSGRRPARTPTEENTTPSAESARPTPNEPTSSPASSQGTESTPTPEPASSAAPTSGADAPPGAGPAPQ